VPHAPGARCVEVGARTASEGGAVTRLALQQAYPAISFRPRTHNWWARLVGQPAECVHLEVEHSWMAALAPDTLYLRGKGSPVRQPPRPEVSLCRRCLPEVLEPELRAYSGRVVAFEPDAENFSQYFFVSAEDFEAAGLQPEVAAVIQQRLDAGGDCCAACPKRAAWLWLPRDEVGSLDDVGRIQTQPGRRLCASHGAAALCRSLTSIAEANLFYVNVPYGEAGAYVWI